MEALPADLTTEDGLAAVAAMAADALRSLARGKIIRVVDWRYRMIVGIRVTPKRLQRTVARDTRGRIRHPPR